MSFSELHRLNSMSLGLAASAYAQLGLPIFPVMAPIWADGAARCPCRDDKCNAVGKHPHIKGWQDLATTDLDQIKAWWQSWPSAGIGLVTGARSGIVVVDADQEEFPDGKIVDGMDNLNMWLDTRDLVLPETLISVTSPGRRHLFFKDPGGVKNRASSFLPCVDTRSTGGFAVLSPSLHRCGLNYAWTRCIEPALMPELLVEGLRSAERRAREAHVGSSSPISAEMYDNALLVGFNGGQRDDLVNKRAYVLRQAGWLKEDVVRDCLSHVLRGDQESTRPDDLWGETQIRAKVDHVWADVSSPSVPEGRAIDYTEFVEAAAQRQGLRLVPPLENGAAALQLAVQEPVQQRPHHFNFDELLTDFGAAVRFVEVNGQHHRKIRGGDWLVFGDGHWTRDVDMRAARSDGIRRLVMSYHADRLVIAHNETERDLLDRFISDLGMTRRINSVIGQAGLLRGGDIERTGLDSDPLLLDTPAETLRLSDDGSVIIEQHVAQNWCTRRIAVPYLPDATAPAWLQHVETMCRYADGRRNPEKELLLQRFCGYCLTGLLDEEKFPFLCGVAGSGKSQFIENLAWTLGSYASMVSKSVVTADDDAHPHHLLRLVGARFAYIAEELDQQAVNVTRLKSLVSGEKFNARGMGKEEEEYFSSAKIWMEGNARFIPRDRTGGFWRRLTLVTLERQVEAEKVIRGGYRETLRTEGSGILNWCLEGYRSWRLIGLAEPEEMQRDVDEYRHDEDVVGQFVDDVIVGVEEWEKLGNEMVEHAAVLLNRVYRVWCEQNGHRPMTSQKLSNELVERFGFKRAAPNVRVSRSLGVGRSRVLYGPPLNAEAAMWAYDPGT